MAAANGKIRCVICNKRKSTLKCRGCSKDFCYTHWDTHRQKLKIKLAEIENNKETFKQSFNQYIQQPNNNNTLIQQINQWEQNSIKKIQQTAEEARQVAVKNTDEYIHQIEIKLNKLTEELRESREEEDFNEINLRQYQEELSRLTKELSKLSNISIREDSKSFINKIALTVSGKFRFLTVRIN
jgi:chromosome condensin MukBEF ATPase and DNA-binding subunit MukB